MAWIMTSVHGLSDDLGPFSHITSARVKTWTDNYKVITRVIAWCVEIWSIDVWLFWSSMFVSHGAHTQLPWLAKMWFPRAHHTSLEGQILVWWLEPSSPICPRPWPNAFTYLLQWPTTSFEKLISVIFVRYDCHDHLWLAALNQSI